MNKIHGKWHAALPLFCLLSALVLTGLRFAAHLDIADAGAGFVNTDSIFSISFNILYVLLLALLALAVRKLHSHTGALRPNACAGVPAPLLGACVAFGAVWDDLHGGAAGAGWAGIFLRWALLLLALLAAGVFFVLAGELLRGSTLRSAMCGALAIPVLHRCFLLLEAFTRHTATAAVYGHVLETLLLVLGVLFFVAHARVLSGSAPGLRLLVFSGYAYTATCAALYLPEVLSLLAGRSFPEPANAGRMVQALATALYAFVFTVQSAKAAERT